MSLNFDLTPLGQEQIGTFLNSLLEKDFRIPTPKDKSVLQPQALEEYF